MVCGDVPRWRRVDPWLDIGGAEPSWKRAMMAACSYYDSSGCLVALPESLGIEHGGYCILSAAHVVANKQRAREAEATFNKHDQSEQEYVTVKLDPNRFFVRYYWKDEEAGSLSELDFCICAVKEDGIEKLRRHDIQPVSLSDRSAEKHMEVVIWQHPSSTGRIKVCAEGRLVGVNEAAGSLQYGIDTSAYSSGSPIFDKSTGHVVGVHADFLPSGLNCGCLVTNILQMLSAAKPCEALRAARGFHPNLAPPRARLSEYGARVEVNDKEHWTALVEQPPDVYEQIVVQLGMAEGDNNRFAAGVGMAAAASSLRLDSTPGGYHGSEAVALFHNGACWDRGMREPEGVGTEVKCRSFKISDCIRMQLAPICDLKIFKRDAATGRETELKVFEDVPPDWHFAVGGSAVGGVEIVRSEGPVPFEFSHTLVPGNASLNDRTRLGGFKTCRYAEEATPDRREQDWTAAMHPPPFRSLPGEAEVEVKILEPGSAIGIGMGKHTLYATRPTGGAAVFNNGEVWRDGKPQQPSHSFTSGDRLVMRLTPRDGSRRKVHISRDGLGVLKSFDVNEGWHWAVGAWKAVAFRILRIE